MRTKSILFVMVCILFCAVNVQAEVITIFDSNATITSGDSYDTLVVKGDGTVVNMTGGTVTKLITMNASVLNMSGGNVTSQMTSYDSSELNISANALISGGTHLYGKSTMNFSGDSAYYIMCYESSKLNFFSGTVTNGITTHRLGVVNIFGGYIPSISLNDSGTANISGGTIGTLHLSSIQNAAGKVNIFGYNLSAVPYGGSYGCGEITGYWHDDTYFNIQLYNRHFYSFIKLYDGPIIEVAVDIKPGSCPNPVNVKSSGVLRVAVLGSEDFDVSTIDLSSIRLASVVPLRSSFEDVATPVSDSNDCDCTTEGPDGYLDLTLKFKTQAVVETLGEVNDGDVLTLTLTGLLLDETSIEGVDCILVRGKFKPINRHRHNQRR